MRDRVQRTQAAVLLTTLCVVAVLFVFEAPSTGLVAGPLEDIGSLGSNSRAVAVNDSGTIVGSSVNASARERGFVYDPATETMDELPTLNGGHAVANDINNNGLVVGTAYSHTINCISPPGFCPIDIDHGYLYDTSTDEIVDLFDVGVGIPPVGGISGSAATAVNDAGLVVGNVRTLTPPLNLSLTAFAYDSATGTVTDLGAYGLNEASDVNENGLVVGVSNGHAAVVDLSTGTLTDLGTFGGSSSSAEAISDNGLVVGRAQVDGNIAFHAFVYELATGVMVDIGTFDAPGAPNSEAYGVNESGIVVGLSATSTDHVAFAYDTATGELLDLGPLGTSSVLRAHDINESGVTVGFGLGPTTAFRTTVGLDRPACTITGSFGDDVLNGTSGDDVICGLAGNDTIQGRGGNDTIVGGPGDDVLWGGSGDDEIAGGPGADFVSGGTGHDGLDGGDGDDVMAGASGDDHLDGGAGADNVRGGLGNDELAGGEGVDVLRGGDGDDLLDGGPELDRVDGGPGTDGWKDLDEAVARRVEFRY
jgi:probable HAF family extracellular repeat protein